jgi:hypothetical protein
MYENFDKSNVALKAEETSRISDITAATARKDDIQKQIDTINAYNKNIEDTQ